MIETTMYCDKCGKKIDKSKTNYRVILKSIEQAEIMEADITVFFSHHQNGGKAIDNGDLCKDCFSEILKMAAIELEEMK